MDFKESTGLYLIAGGVIAFVLVQSIFFLVKAWKQGEKLGIDKKKLRDAITSSAVFTIPSALSVLATVIVLAPSLGLVIPWVRLSVLGNLLYETKAAGDAMSALGQEGGISSTITDPAIFAGVAWVMTLGICFSLVLLPFVAKPLHRKMLNLGKKDETKEETTEKKEKKSGGIAGFIDLLTPAVFIGLIGAFVARAIAGKFHLVSRRLSRLSSQIPASSFRDRMNIQRRLFHLSLATISLQRCVSALSRASPISNVGLWLSLKSIILATSLS